MNKEALNHLWNLFENQGDGSTPSTDLINTCIYLVKNFGFDVEVLPEYLYDEVIEKMNIHAKDSYYEDQAFDAMMELCV